MNTMVKYTIKQFGVFSFFSLSNTYHLPIPFALSLYKGMAEEILQTARLFSVSQFFDEQQGLIQNSLALAQEMAIKYELLAYTTVSFDQPEPAPEGKPYYVIHFFGPKHLNSLDRIIRYGGSGLLSFICGFEEEISDWSTMVPEIGRNLSQLYRSDDDRKRLLNCLARTNGFVFMENNSINAYVHPADEQKLINLVTSLFIGENILLKRDDNLLTDWLQ